MEFEAEGRTLSVRVPFGLTSLASDGIPIFLATPLKAHPLDLTAIGTLPSIQLWIMDEGALRVGPANDERSVVFVVQNVDDNQWFWTYTSSTFGRYGKGRFDLRVEGLEVLRILTNEYLALFGPEIAAMHVNQQLYGPDAYAVMVHGDNPAVFVFTLKYDQTEQWLEAHRYGLMEV